MTVLSIKEILLWGLQQALFRMYEENGSSFTVLSHEHADKSHHLQAGETIEALLASAHWQNIPLKKKQRVKHIIYVSALPQRLLADVNSSPVLNSEKSAEEALKETTLKIASYLKKVGLEPIISEPDHKSAQLLQCKPDDYALRLQLWSQFQIGTQQPGYLSLHLLNRGIEQWLQQANMSVLTDCSSCDLPPSASTESTGPRSELVTQQLWQAQYTYARCCTLLRLWQPHSLGLGSTRNSLQPSVKTSFCFNEAQEQLVHALISTADDMFWIPYRFSSKQYLLLLKSAAQVCQAFEEFYSNQISGFGQIFTAEFATMRSHNHLTWQAKFHLVLTTKNILETLLCKHLKVKASPEL